MDFKKWFLSGLAGGVVCFLLGWAIFGVLLMDFFTAHAGPAKNVGRDPHEMLILYLVLGNLVYGFLLAYIFIKAGVATIGNGIVTGAIVGFLIILSNDCMLYGTTWVTSRTAIAADAVAFAVLSAIAGAVVAWVASMGKKP